VENWVAIKIKVLLLGRWKRPRTIFVGLPRRSGWSPQNYDEQRLKTLHRWELSKSDWDTQCLLQNPKILTWTTKIKSCKENREVDGWFRTGRITVPGVLRGRIKSLNYRIRNYRRPPRVDHACPSESAVHHTFSHTASRFCKSSYDWDTWHRGMPSLQSLQRCKDPWFTLTQDERRIVLRLRQHKKWRLVLHQHLQRWRVGKIVRLTGRPGNVAAIAKFQTGLRAPRKLRPWDKIWRHDARLTSIEPLRWK